MNHVEISDVLFHCFAPHIRGLYTLCGKPYESVMFANDPISFKKRSVPLSDVEVCQVCANHPDMPLALLADVA